MYIIATDRFNATGDRLLKAFTNIGEEARQVRNYSGKKIVSKKNDIIINWGCKIPVCSTREDTRILNQKTVGKEIQYKRLLRAYIPIPDVYNEEEVLDNLPVLYRNPHGFGGRDIFLMESQEDIANREIHDDWVFVKYIPKIMELRLHVCGNTLIGMSKKVPRNVTDVTWNNHTGAKQDTYKNKTTEQFMRNLGIDAVKAVGYEFGAVDVIIDKYGTPYVLEVNSAPALISNEDRINGWVNAFVTMNDNR